jgi:hypothetical protein
MKTVLNLARAWSVGAIGPTGNSHREEGTPNAARQTRSDASKEETDEGFLKSGRAASDKARIGVENL